MDAVQYIIERLKHDAAGPLSDCRKTVFVARAPARLDVMGGLAVSGGALGCGMTLEPAAAVAVQRRDDRRIILRRYGPPDRAADPPDTFSLSLDDFYGTAALLPNETLQALFADGHQWAAPLAGAFPMLARHRKINRRSHGANIAFYSDIPDGYGLGAGSALRCATLFALAAALQLILDPLEIALLAQRQEHTATGFPADVMEPLTSVLGKRGQLLVVAGQPCQIQEHLAIPEGLAIGAVDPGIEAADRLEAADRGRVSAFVAQCLIARCYRDLGVKKDPDCLAELAPELHARYFSHLLPESLRGGEFLDECPVPGDRIASIDPQAVYLPRGAADYCLGEHLRARRFVEALRGITASADGGEGRARAAAAGALLVESHRNAARDLGLTVPETDLLVDLIVARGPGLGLYGARAAGGGHTLAVLMDDTPTAADALEGVLREFQRKTSGTPRVLRGSSTGAAESPILQIPPSDVGNPTR